MKLSDIDRITAANTSTHPARHAAWFPLADGPGPDADRARLVNGYAFVLGSYYPDLGQEWSQYTADGAHITTDHARTMARVNRQVLRAAYGYPPR